MDKRILIASIPARAGEPPMTPVSKMVKNFNPRACGGTPTRVRNFSTGRLQSPRVRGNRARTLARQPRLPSIPARAGEPCLNPRPFPLTYFNPRACGGTILGTTHWEIGELQSPRVRGNRIQQRARRTPHASIPARAGEPSWVIRCTSPSCFNPRACGGTSLPVRRWRCRRLQSPRVRGNRQAVACSPRCGTSIPARAGEPRLSRGGRHSVHFNPRACGGTRSRGSRKFLHILQSPRVRGNLDVGPQADVHPRFNPRACGGNHHHREQNQKAKTSIPARAGEP